MDFLEIESVGKRLFEQFPFVKRSLKRVYQLAMYSISNEKIKSEGDISRITPDDGYEYFYGYYDKSPWDADDRFMIALKVRQAYKKVAPKEPGDIVIIDTHNGNNVTTIATTKSWNVQQGCMAQWLGPDFKTKIIYNDYRNGQYCSVVYNVTLQEERVYPCPIYDVARDGSYALSLDFSRLHRMRPGYGYSNLPDHTNGMLCPDLACIYKLDLHTGQVVDLIKYTDFARFEANDTMVGAEHKVNHLMICPDGSRFMVLHRWFQKGKKNTRLVTINAKGTDWYNLSDDVFVSHCYWKNNNEILAFLRKRESGDHYYLMEDKTQKYKLLWSELKTDGHCSYSPNGNYVITDTYPNRKRNASIFLCTEDVNSESCDTLGKVFSPFKYDNDTRCDLHPRWNRKGNEVIIDSVHDGKRGLYTIPVLNNSWMLTCSDYRALVSVIIPCFNTADTIIKTLESLENQSYKNLEVLIVNDGSTDDLTSIVSEYCRTSSLEIKYLEQFNSGVSVARNHGIRAAQGKYIAFIDGDDIYHRRFLEQTVAALSVMHSDVVLTYQSRRLDEVSKDNSVSLFPLKCSIEKFMSEFMYNKEKIVFAGMLYSKEIIDANEISFSENTKYGEDIEFVWKYLSHCKTGVIVEKKMYGYFNNPKSAVNTVRWEKVDLVQAMHRVEEYMKANRIDFVEKYSQYMVPRTVWTVMKTFAIGGRKDYFEKYLKGYPVREAMSKLYTYAPNALLKGSSMLYLIHPKLYYHAIRLVYRIRRG